MNKPMILVGAGAVLIFVSLVLMGLELGPVVSLPFLVVGALLTVGGAGLASRAQRKFMWSLQTRVGNLETRAQKVQDQLEDAARRLEGTRSELGAAVDEARRIAARRSQDELALLEGQVQQHEAQLREAGRLIAAGRVGEALHQG